MIKILAVVGGTVLAAAGLYVLGPPLVRWVLEMMFKDTW